jgi:hypothetical protein
MPTCWPGTARSALPRVAAQREGSRPAQKQWFDFVEDTDNKGRPIKRKVERQIATRELSLLAGPTGCKAARPAAAAGRRPAALRGGGHPAARAGLPRGRDRVAPARRSPAGQEGADVRAHRCAGHQPGRALQAGPRERPGLGDHAGPWQAGGRCRGQRLRLHRPASVGRPHRRQTAWRAIAAWPRVPNELRLRRHLDGLFVSARKADAQGRAGHRHGLSSSAAGQGHRALALQRADVARPARPTCARTRCSTARCCAPARRCR